MYREPREGLYVLLKRTQARQGKAEKLSKCLIHFLQVATTCQPFQGSLYIRYSHVRTPPVLPIKAIFIFMKNEVRFEHWKIR